MFGVEGLLVLAALGWGAGLFGGLDRWGRGDWDQFVFRYDSARRAWLTHGEWPLWNPFPGGGNVLLAHPHSPSLSPWSLPSLVLGAPLGLRVQAVLMAALGAVGVSALLGRWGLSAGGRFVGGALMMFSSHYTLHIAEGHLEWTALGVVPWVFLCLDADAPWRRWAVVAAGALLASVLLHGAIYVPAVFLPVLTLWAALESLRRRSLDPLARWLAAGALAALLAAVVLLPRVEFLRANPRGTESDERISPRMFGRMAIDPRQASLYRATRDLNNPPAEQLGRVLPAELPLYRRKYESRLWTRLDVSLATTSDWAQLDFEGFTYVLRFDEPEGSPIPPWRLDTMPPSREGIAVQNPEPLAQRAEVRATLYARLSQEGGLRLVVRRGHLGNTYVRVEREGQLLLDAAMGLPPEPGASRQQFVIPREDVLGPRSPSAVAPGGRWHALEVTLRTTADWCAAQADNCPCLFRVPAPQLEAASDTRWTAESLALPPLAGRPLRPRAVKAQWLVLGGEEGLRIVATQGRVGTTRIELRGADGRPIESTVRETTEPGGEKHYEFHVPAEALRSLPAEPTPLRWRLDALGMTYGWHEYACYLTWPGLVMALTGLALGCRRHWPLWCCGAAAALVAMGSALPLSLWALLRLAPLYGSLQVPSRFLMAVVFVLAVAAGCGADRIQGVLQRRFERRSSGRFARRAAAALGLLLGAIVYAETAASAWNVFADVFTCPARNIPHHDTFAPRYVEDEVRYAAMHSALAPYLAADSGVLRHYENIIVRQGNVRVASDPAYRGEVDLESGAGSARLIERTMARARIELRATRPDRLVLNQNFFRGWKARLQSARGDHRWLPAEPNRDGLVSVAVDANQTEVEFRYVPDSFVLGAVVSALTLAGCAVYLASGRLARRAAPGDGATSPESAVEPAASSGEQVALAFGDTASSGRRVQPAGAPAQRCRIARAIAWLTWIAAINAPFVLAHPSWCWLVQPLARSLAVGAVLLVMPGLPVVGWLVGRRVLIAPRPVWVVAISWIVLVAVLAAHCACGRPPSGAGTWNAVWLTTNLLLAASWLGGGVAWPRAACVDLADRGAGVLMAAGLFLAAYVVYGWAATRVVPPQEDHDFEIMATAYSLATRFEPLWPGDRGSVYEFAHPVGFHFLVAGSFLDHDRFEALRPYDESARRALMAARGEPFRPPATTVDNVHGIAGSRRAVEVVGEDYRLEPPLGRDWDRLPVLEFENALATQYYLNHPFALEARTPSIFLAAMTVASLAMALRRISGRRRLALLVASAYALSPEVLVRSAYGGYFAISMFAALEMLLAVEPAPRRPARSAWLDALAAGALAGVMNHKLILLPAAVVLWENLQLGRAWTPRRALVALAHPIVLGFAAGTAAFWAYGLAVEPRALLVDHLRHHLVDRIAHYNPLGYADYPSVAALWVELNRHSGSLLLPLGLAALLALAVRREPADDPRPPNYLVHGWRNTPGLWLAWAVLLAMAFSAVDWRQTKHLMPLLLVMHVAPVRWAGRRPGAAWLVAVVFVAIVLANLAGLATLSADFASFPITPAW